MKTPDKLILDVFRDELGTVDSIIHYLLNCEHGSEICLDVYNDIIQNHNIRQLELSSSQYIVDLIRDKLSIMSEHYPDFQKL